MDKQEKALLTACQQGGVHNVINNEKMTPLAFYDKHISRLRFMTCSSLIVLPRKCQEQRRIWKICGNENIKQPYRALTSRQKHQQRKRRLAADPEQQYKTQAIHDYRQCGANMRVSLYWERQRDQTYSNCRCWLESYPHVYDFPIRYSSLQANIKILLGITHF